LMPNLQKKMNRGYERSRGNRRISTGNPTTELRASLQEDWTKTKKKAKEAREL
jgi:hypothetical protein